MNKNNAQILFTFTLLLAAFALAACDAASPALQTTPTSEATPKREVAPIASPTLSPTITLTPTITATFSPEQITETAIRAQIIKVDQTHQHYMNIEVPATLEARNAKCKDGFVMEMYLDVIWLSNDQWTLFTCSPKAEDRGKRWTPGVVDFGKRYTQIIKTDLSTTWTIQHDTFDYSKIDRPNALMMPLLWTADGKYLYLYPSYYPGPDGGGQSEYFRSHINDLYRINLETGEFKPFLKSNQFGDLAFSPDDQLLAYSDQVEPDVIHIRNVESETDLQVKLNEDIVASGGFTWNSDSTKVVIFVGYGKEEVGDDPREDLSGIGIYVLMPQNMHAQKVLVKDPRLFIPDRCADNDFWVDESTMCLYSVNSNLDSWNKIYTFNIRTGTVEFLRPFP
jgi:hypothetical protein